MAGRRPDTPERRKADRQRWHILRQVQDALELPMLLLGFVWLVLLVIDLVRGLSPLLHFISTAIWVVFIADFLLRLVIAPRKLAFLRGNWLTAVSLLLPALRVFRIFRVVRALRAARAVRGVRLVRVLTSINRGMRSLRRTFARRGFGYVVAGTAIVTFAGAAGIYAFEKESEGGGLTSYGHALWWTAMLVTTVGSEYWPRTAEGRVLTLLLSLYAFAVWGYITATIASFFVGQDADNPQAPLASAKAIEALHAEVRALREELRQRGASKSG